MRRIGLHWFKKDLRLQDNASLQAISKEVDQLICLYLHPSESVAAVDLYSLSTQEVLGTHRKRFIRESLDDLNISLSKLGQQLVELEYDVSAIDTLIEFVKAHDVNVISCEWHCGFNEKVEWEQLKKALPDQDFIQLNSSTLYQENGLPFDVAEMPDTFTPFRKKVEKNGTLREAKAILSLLPPQVTKLMPDNQKTQGQIISSKNSSRPYYSRLVGGESAAQRQVDYYLWEKDLLSSYKETRNGLDGWDFSSKLSAWLAHGCISPTTLLGAIDDYENQRTKNDSTYWLFFELLWREFFHWQHVKNGQSSFKKQGPKRVEISTHFDREKFDDWCKGKTGYKIVDACMQQLNQTGFMSNRGRQLVASCFVHELALDWRYGAAYFEYQLIDFDVASNFGNWQYLAGVGADPRGHRQFNLEKQTDIYDPTREFIQSWLSS